MSPELITALMFGALIVSLLAGLPIAFGMGGIAALVVYFMNGTEGLMTIVFNTFGAMWQVTYIAIPLFIYMGVLLENSGIADALFEMMYRWSGRLRGGLAVGTVVICAIFAAMTGVTGAATVTMGLIAVPAMLNRGYEKGLALGTVAGAGTLGILIPPSIMSIILAVIARLSIGKLFMAGVFPGLVLTALFIAYIFFIGLIKPQTCPAHGQKFTLREKIVSVKAAVLPMLIILAVLGSIFFGIATPTEASAVGCAAVIIATALNRRLTWSVVKKAAYTTLGVTGMCMWIFFGALCFTAVYTGGGGIKLVSNLILGLEASRWSVFAMVMAIVFVLGCFLDNTAIIFLVAPLAFPIIVKLGFDPIWFGILFIINTQMGYITPPFGYNLFYLKGVAPPGVSMADIYRSIVPFLVVMIVGFVIVTVFPQIALWLPEKMMVLRK